jgi:hypothetical protein
MSWIRAIQPKAAIVVVVLGLCQVAVCQQVSEALLHPPMMESTFEPAPAPTVMPTPMTLPEAPVRHRFWDGENSLLFATSAAFSAADFVVTRDNLRSGGRELNPITSWFSGSTAGLAVNFAGETAGVVGLSYFFHKTGHHKLERAVSMLNIGASAGAVSFDLTHR